MLRSSTTRLRESVSRDYVCWQCLSKIQQRTPTSVRQASNAARPSRSGGATLRLGHRQFNAGRASHATVESATNLPQDPHDPARFLSTKPDNFKSDIREKLKQWELENVVSLNPMLDMYGKPVPGQVLNTGIHSQTNDFYLENLEKEGDDVEDSGGISKFEYDLVDVGLRRNFLIPGDMVEIVSAGSRRRELAIFIQEFDVQGQFYTMSGRWLHKATKVVKFHVPNFVEAEEVEEIKPYLPTGDVTEEMQDKLHDISFQVPRNIGKSLIQKMIAFWNEADKAYQAAAVQMDNAHSLVAHPTKFTYATLQQIANKLLSNTLPKLEDGNFPAPTLYALHRTMLQDDIGFCPQVQQVMRGESEYEINSLKEVEALKRITEKIRINRTAGISSEAGSKPQTTATQNFNKFIQKARQIIDGSRKLRDFTPCGTLGPSKTPPPKGANIRIGEVMSTFSEADREWLFFLESWACLKSFHLHSSFNGIGSSILRSIGRYNDVPLDRTTAFTCLMELGVIPPWETQSAFELRLPYTSQRFDNRLNSTLGATSDRMGHMRKNWKNLQVYCIDDISAHEIDDGISIESTNNPEELWVHVHIADPAAHLEPHSPAAQYAELLTSSIYLPDRVVPMLHREWTQNRLSLSPGSRCLTYSTKVNMAGDILDTIITPGVVNNVIHVAPAALYEAMFDSPRPEISHRMVGEHTFDTSHNPSRRVLQWHDLSEKHLHDLRLMHKLSQARGKVQQMRGAMQSWAPSPEASTSFGGAPWVKPTAWGARYHGDPTIRISIPPFNERGVDLSAGSKTVVASMMLLASEAAARWCHARGIPVIFRISPFNPAKGDPLKFYHEHVQPSKDEDGHPELEPAMQYLRLVGKTQPSTTPGPHLGIGSDMTMQITSPLRRFGDLLNQWQIEGALREEARLGTSLVGNTRDDFLPYSKAQIDAMLPRIAERERFIKQGTNKANREWILKYLVRAWKFGEDKLPSPLLFYARSVNPIDKSVGGVLPSYLVGGLMAIPDDVKPEEIEIGDIFEVDIAHINVYERVLHLKLVKRMPRSKIESLPGFELSFAPTPKIVTPTPEVAAIA
ncbi:RNB-domain-containing protein [Acephala macrosclerotiorum]|nr:RNB-domain-containing protein [Acephala macrosclerotiorum]